MVIKGLPDRDLLRPEEVAKYFAVSDQTIRRWCIEEKLEYCKPNGVLRVFKTSVLKLIESTKNAHIETVAEVETKIKKAFQKERTGFVKRW